MTGPLMQPLSLKLDRELCQHLRPCIIRTDYTAIPGEGGALKALRLNGDSVPGGAQLQDSRSGSFLLKESYCVLRTTVIIFSVDSSCKCVSVCNLIQIRQNNVLYLKSADSNLT